MKTIAKSMITEKLVDRISFLRKAINKCGPEDDLEVPGEWHPPSFVAPFEYGDYQDEPMIVWGMQYNLDEDGDGPNDEFRFYLNADNSVKRVEYWVYYDFEDVALGLGDGVRNRVVLGKRDTALLMKCFKALDEDGGFIDYKSY